MSSYPKFLGTFTAGAATEAVIGTPTGEGIVGRVVFQVVFAGSFDGDLRVSRRLTGGLRADPPGPVTLPWVQSAYRNESGQADVANTVDIDAAGIYSVIADGTDIRILTVGGTTGTATVWYHVLSG